MPLYKPEEQQPSVYERILGGLLGKPNSYGGLLTSEDQKAIQQQQLLALGSSLLQASGPQPYRTSTGQALGQGIMAAQQAGQQGGQDMLQSMLLKTKIQQAKQPQQMKTHVVGNALVDDAGNVVYQGQALDNVYGRVNPGDFTPESLAEFEKTKDWSSLKRVWAPVNPTVQLVNGVPTVVQPSRTGAPTTTDPLSTPDSEAEAKRRLAEAAAAGQAGGTSLGQAAFDLPRVEQNTSQAVKTLRDLRSHKGLGAITGLYSLAPIIPGTDQAGADALAKQVEGKTFLEAFNTLKGGGAITETEGTKATSAIGRLQRAQSKEDYQAALDDLTSVLQAGLERARKTASRAPGSAHPAAAPKRVRVDAQGNVIGN
jgi:hypothetical protein